MCRVFVTLSRAIKQALFLLKTRARSVISSLHLLESVYEWPEWWAKDGIFSGLSVTVAEDENNSRSRISSLSSLQKLFLDLFEV